MKHIPLLLLLWFTYWRVLSVLVFRVQLFSSQLDLVFCCVTCVSLSRVTACEHITEPLNPNSELSFFSLPCLAVVVSFSERGEFGLYLVVVIFGKRSEMAAAASEMMKSTYLTKPLLT